MPQAFLQYGFQGLLAALENLADHFFGVGSFISQIDERRYRIEQNLRAPFEPRALRSDRCQSGDPIFELDN